MVEGTEGSHHKEGSTKMHKHNMICAGIDTGKRKLDAAIDGCSRQLQIENTPQGHRTLSLWLRRHRVVRVGIEASGGHEQAVGLTVRRDRLPALAREWREAARTWPAEKLAPPRVYDLELPAESVTEPLLTDLEPLEPFGAGNPEPVFRIGALRSLAPARAFGRGHAALRVGRADGSPGAGFELVAWGWEERAGRELPDRFEVLARIERDRWRGGVRAVLEELRPLDRPPH